VTLPAFAALRRAAAPLLPSAGHAAIDWHLMAAGPTAVNPPQRPAPVGLDRRTDGQWDRRTDGRTDAWQFHKPCSACYASSVTNGTVSSAITHAGFCIWIHCESKKTRRQTLAHNFTKYQPIFVFFIDGLGGKFATNSWLNIPPRLKHATALPCEIWMSTK